MKNVEQIDPVTPSEQIIKLPSRKNIFRTS